jgi:MFS family permease
LAAYALNEIALSISALTLSLLVLRRTGSSLAAAAFFLCAQFFPAFLSPPLVGRLAARSPRRTLTVLYGLEALLFGLLAWLAHRFSLAAVLGVVLIDGALALAARAIARAASAAVTAPIGLLREANALTNTVFSVAFVLGPGLAGVIVANGGTVPALLANAGLFAVIALVLAVASSLPPAPEPSEDGSRVRAALAYVRSRPGLGALFAFQGAAVFFFAVTVPVEVVLATHTLHAGAGGFGAIGSVWGGGAVIGSLAYVRLRFRTGRWLICTSVGILAAGIGVMAAAPNLGVALAGAAVAGVGNGMEGVAVRNAMQELIPPEQMAMMMSLSESLVQALPGGGILLGGALTALGGPRLALAVAAVGAAVVSAAGWPLLRTPVVSQAVA